MADGTTVGKRHLVSLLALLCRWSFQFRVEVVPRWYPLVRAVELRLYSFHLGSPIPDLKPRCNCELTVLGGESATNEALLSPFVAPSVVRRRFARGEVCFAWRRDQQLLSYIWVASLREGVEEVLQIVCLRGGEIYLFDAFTAPALRGQGLYAALLSAVLRHYRHRGVKRALIFTTSDNVGSQRGIYRAGFNLFQIVRCWKILRMCVYWHGPVLTVGDTAVRLEPWR